MTLRLQVIGGGKMGEALVAGLVASGWATASAIGVLEPMAERREELAVAIPGLHLLDEPAQDVDALVAVKPQHVSDVCASLAVAEVPRVVSIAAGVTTATMEAVLGPSCHVVRVMPNTPSLVGQGMSAIAAGSAATADDLAWATEVLQAVGEVVVVDEADLDAVTGVSGSGPAYVFLLAEAMRDAAVNEGLAADVADTLVRQTLLGAATLLVDSGEQPDVLRANVTSPGGTTAAGIGVLTEHGFTATVTAAIRAATERSNELGSA